MSPTERIVSNTGPFISLERVQHLYGHDLLKKMYAQILVPPLVLEELAQGKHCTVEEYLTLYDLHGWVQPIPVTPETTLAGLDMLHEAEILAISLAYQKKLQLLIEEADGRDVAERAGIKISGIAGQIRFAYLQGLATKEEATTLLTALYAANRINKAIYQALLQAL